MKKDDLDLIEFPLGDYKKDEIRDLALNLTYMYSIKVIVKISVLYPKEIIKNLLIRI